MRPPLIALLTTLALAACARGASTPQGALRSYHDALTTGDQALAWDLMSSDYRARTTEERFTTEFERRLEAGEALTDELEAGSKADASLSASLAYSRHETVTLAYIDGQWRITGGVAHFYDRSTPERALIAFIHAVEQDDAAELMRLIPATYRAQMTEQELAQWLDTEQAMLLETVALLRANADAPIVTAEQSATLRYGGREMQFLREGLEWVIDDF